MGESSADQDGIDCTGRYHLPFVEPQAKASYVEWLATIPRAEQYTSAVAVGELYKGAFRSSHLENIERLVLPRLTILPYDTPTAREYGRVRAILEQRGRPLPDADLQIAATALCHDLVLVTGKIKHFERIESLKIETVLADSRDFT